MTELATRTMNPDYLITCLSLIQTPRSSARKSVPAKGMTSPESSSKVSAIVEMMNHLRQESDPARNVSLNVAEILLSRVEAIGESIFIEQKVQVYKQ